jgi:hypothetical protein
MLLRSSSHLHASLWHALVNTSAGDGVSCCSAESFFSRTAAFPKGKQNGEKKEHL